MDFPKVYFAQEIFKNGFSCDTPLITIWFCFSNDKYLKI